VYESDPVTNPDAVRFDKVTYDEVLQKRLGVMDATAIALCRDNNMAMRVISINERGALLRMAQGDNVGTLITST
jgi:uridylate kinase